jgi:hypothetical protein
MNMREVGAELLHADRQTKHGRSHRHDEDKGRFCNFANARNMKLGGGQTCHRESDLAAVTAAACVLQPSVCDVTPLPARAEFGIGKRPCI